MDAKAVRLHEVLEGDKQYVVPAFQRYYSWEQDHWEELWKDILEVIPERQEGKRHFIGAIVCTAADKQFPYRVPQYVLIDGQQRLATVTILLCTLRDIAAEQNLN
jgi:uncharacterized protein with ParB-like and HNH nuclease domain